jgi:hypothetical protein
MVSFLCVKDGARFRPFANSLPTDGLVGTAKCPSSQSTTRDGSPLAKWWTIANAWEYPLQGFSLLWLSGLAHALPRTIQLWHSHSRIMPSIYHQLLLLLLATTLLLVILRGQWMWHIFGWFKETQNYIVTYAMLWPIPFSLSPKRHY